MAVRLPIIIKASKKEIKTVALANTGYETDKPEILLPFNIAAKLFQKNINSAKLLLYKTAAGETMLKLIGVTKIKVKCQDKESKFISAKVLTSSQQDEIIISDKLLEALKIIILKPAKGYWRFTNDPANKIRKSTRMKIYAT